MLGSVYVHVQVEPEGKEGVQCLHELQLYNMVTMFCHYLLSVLFVDLTNPTSVLSFACLVHSLDLTILTCLLPIVYNA